METALDRTASASKTGETNAPTAEASHNSDRDAQKAARSEIDLMKSTLLNMATMSAPNTVLQAEPGTSAHRVFQDCKLQALREMSQAANWSFESLSELGANKMGSLLDDVETNALEKLVKQDPIAFRELFKSAAEPPSGTQQDPKDLKMQQEAWEAKATAEEMSSSKASSHTPAAPQSWHDFKNAQSSDTVAKQSKPCEYTSVAAKYACLSIFRKTQPWKSMTTKELEIHRGLLMAAWAERHGKPKQKAIDGRLAAEVSAQKSAMHAFEHKGHSRESNAAPAAHPVQCDTSNAHAETTKPLAGEGDMDYRVADFCDDAKWYKRTAPHAAREDPEKAAGKALVRDIREIYEKAYGVIDEHHEQSASRLNDSLGEYESTIGQDPYSFKTNNRSSAASLTTAVPQPSSQSPPAANPITKSTAAEASLVSKSMAIMKPTTLQHNRDLNKLLDMYRKNSDSYVEAIGRLQRKVQSLQQQVERARVKPQQGPQAAHLLRPQNARAASVSANPIDGTTSRPNLIPQTGNFASPTGFVGESFAPETVDPRIQDRRSSIPSARYVRREEAVFSGQQPLQKASLQEIIDHLQDRFHAFGHEPNSGPSLSNAAGQKSIDKGQATKEHAQKSTFGERVLATFVGMVFAGSFLAGCAYSVGVVVEYFRSGPSSGPEAPGSANFNEDRGWGNGLRSNRSSRVRRDPMLETEPFGTQSAAIAHKSASEKDIDNVRNILTVLMLPLAGLGIIYAWFTSVGR